MEKKIKIAVVLAILGGVGWFGWTILRYQVVFRMKVQAVVEKKVQRFPPTAVLVDLPNLVKEAAREAHVPDENLTTSVLLEAKTQGPIVMYFATVTVADGSHAPIEWTVGVDRDHFKNVLLPDIEKLEAAGIKFKK